MMQAFATPSSALTVPSPLLSAEARLRAKADVGAGQGGGYHTTRSIDVRLAAGLRELRSHQTSRPGLPPSPTLPHKGGGSRARARLDFHSQPDKSECRT